MVISFGNSFTTRNFRQNESSDYFLISKMKTKPIPHKLGVVEEKLRIANAHAKTIDINKLQETIEKARASTPK